MKILYIDISLRGHRIGYLKALTASQSSCIALLPELENSIPCVQFKMKSGYDKKRTIGTYLAWIREIRVLIKKESPDVVHFLCGDALYRYMGIGLKLLKTRKIITYHHMQFGKVRNIALKRLFSRSEVGIVHTEYLQNRLEELGVHNVSKIEYPVFANSVNIDTTTAKKKIGIPMDRPCIVVLGGTQRYKGIDILLSALQNVKVPFFLYITGVERDFSLDKLKKMSEPFKDNVLFNMQRLTDEEYSEALSATDIMVLPYRREFDGASGPMLEAVWNRKVVVGAGHGSMGNLVEKYELGAIFETENSDSLTKVLNMILSRPIRWSTKAENFRKELTLEKFLHRYMVLYEEKMRNE